MERSELPFRMARRIEALPAVTRMATCTAYTLHGEWSPDPEPRLNSMETRNLWDLQRTIPTRSSHTGKESPTTRARQERHQ